MVKMSKAILVVRGQFQSSQTGRTLGKACLSLLLLAAGFPLFPVFDD